MSSPKVSNSTIKNLNNSEVKGISNNELKKTAIRMMNKIKKDMCVQLKEFKKNSGKYLDEIQNSNAGCERGI
jgi:hypothetical protein